MPEKIIAGYYRLSVEDDDIKAESNSITNQRLLIKRYIAEHPELSGYKYCEFYDDGFSGTTMDRPGLQAMLEEIKRKEIGCVIVKDLSRFSRDYIELGTYMEQIFPFMGIRFISITERYDSQNCIGKTVGIEIGFQSLLADFYCKDVSEKVRSAVMAKKNQGKYATGNTPFGYCKAEDNPDELLIVQKEAEVIRYIFELSLSGQNLTQICRTLNDEKVPTPLEYKNQRKKQNRKELQQEHKYWQPGTISAILKNESYLGHMVYHKSVQAKVGGSQVILKPRQEWKIFENHHPAIVSREVFDKVQKKFPEKTGLGRRPIQYALKGKVHCGYCNRRLKVMKLAGERLYYYCPNQKLNSNNDCVSDRISNNLLEKIVLKEIKAQISNLEELNRVRREMAEKQCIMIRKVQREISGKEEEISELIEKKANLLEAYHEGRYTRNEYMDQRRQLEQQIMEKQAQQKKLEKQLAASSRRLNTDTGDDERFLQYTSLETVTKEMVDAFIEKIKISNDKTIDIYWKYKKETGNTPNSIAIL